MLHPTAKSNMAGTKALGDTQLSKSILPAPYDHKSAHLKAQAQAQFQAQKAEREQKLEAAAKRRSLPKNFLLKRLDILYWKRLLRYIYVRFLRMRSSPRAIARGVAAGAFAGSFPLLGIQMLFGVAIASCVRGNKVVAGASTWISNPITYVPLFALNFHIGRLILRLPPTEMPTSAVGLDVWMSMGLDVGAALMLGSLITGVLMSVAGYYVGLRVAERVQARKLRKSSQRRDL